ncbi:hypothetical protein P3X46_010256 [Hevea brasiliensis]|uniref:Fe2OG dioxygenase domain-containing protein n=1 Tax=Hevea brasiliensis TaxID=3981 RepID=A0ABQ9MEK8_HEVBR|nr:probable 2-oxoglutarate-dependent dioxygenase AOP1 [Hevea brasiliensis]KAJ9178368.1 hypothetical protein P3X46_010256 [Hevea brasiliensis]
MGSETVPKIPLVNLSNESLKPGTSSWHSACKDIRQALEEYGCLEVVYNKPSVEFHNRILAALEELFQLPQEVKMKNVNPKPAHGYMGKISTFPIHEGLGIEYATSEDECQKFTSLMWPDGNGHFCETVHSYAKMVAELQQLLVEMLCESYGIEKHSESHIKSTTYLLRLLRYRRSQAETNLGFKGHTDKSFVSILHQNHVKGLEIRTKDGEWISYEPSSHSSFAVIAGDVCMAWSNDRIKSCYHRVIVEGEEVRYAVGLFSFLTGLIKAPEELVDEEHPLQYYPFEHQGLLDFYQSSNSLNKGDSNMVKAFCGV